MTDSPAVRAPLDPKEQPILDQLLALRSKLELMCQDRSTYVKSHDVVELYNQVIEQVAVLNEMRTTKRTEQNRVDTVLDDCFQLISLSYMTVGKTQEAPAVYAAVSTMKRLLDHLKESTFYSPKDLESLSAKLHEYREQCDRGKGHHSSHLVMLLEARIEVCQTTLDALELNLSRLTPELTPKYDQLVSILRTLSACNTRSKFPEDEVEDYFQQLKEIKADLEPYGIRPFESTGTKEEKLAEMRERLKVTIEHPEPAPEVKKLIETLLQCCLLWVVIMKEKQGRIAEPFRDLYETLLTIRNQLEKLSLTQAWSLREIDLYSFQRQLDRFDEARVDGNFFDALGRPAAIYEQRTLLYLLRKSYAIIWTMITASEPVSEALLPIYNQLMTLRKCLLEVKRSGGVSSPREMYPYSMKLNSIDNMRVDGKFMVGSDIPDGQGSVTHLLEECFELAYDLRSEADEGAPAAKSAESETKEVAVSVQ